MALKLASSTSVWKIRSRTLQRLNTKAVMRWAAFRIERYVRARDIPHRIEVGPQQNVHEKTPSNCSEYILEDSFSRVIRALGNTSPATANALTQHVSDSWAVKASSDPSSPTTVANNVQIKQRSSFLSRMPISLDRVLQTASSPWAR